MESNKTLEIKNSMYFTYHFVFFFLIIELYFIILAVFAPIFSPFTDAVITLEIPNNEAKGVLKSIQ